MKKLGIVLLVILGLFVVVSLILPGKVRVERSIMIQAPVKVVFDQVNTLANWQHWSYWDNIDPEMKNEYEGPESGAGAVHKWTSNHEQVGNGSLTIVESNEPNSIITSLYFEGMGSSMGGWTFDETESGVNTSIYMEIEMPFYNRIVPGLMMDDWLGKDFNKTLAGLKSRCESLPAQPESKWTVEVVDTEPATVLTTKVITDQMNFQAKMSEALGKIIAEMGKQELHQSGPMFVIYNNWSPDTVDMEPGIPVDNEGKSSGDIIASNLPSVKAMKLDFYGDYNGLGEAHEFIDKYAQANSLTINGSPWEVYVTDPENEPDTTKWLTKIYYPIQ